MQAKRLAQPPIWFSLRRRLARRRVVCARAAQFHAARVRAPPAALLTPSARFPAVGKTGPLRCFG